MMRPSKPSCISVSTARPPARFAPTTTNVRLSVTNGIVIRWENPRMARRRKYSTGVETLDARIAELIAQTDFTQRDAALITEIVTTALLLGQDAASRLDLKIVNAALKEMRYAFKVFSPYR